ncbi:MAG: hypothetical protein BWY08_01285 [Bacteroidetes bacterium ADurb.Bin174]|nr:MAG: hypothetical protein BWY08_01285 [Bacteroidetes bacterium ADurb.Bin174]
MIRLACGEGSGAIKYANTATKTAMAIITKPNIAPLFFLRRLQAAFAKEGDEDADINTNIFLSVLLYFENNKALNLLFLY